MIGFYSEKAAAEGGTNIYKTPSGGEVEITAVFTSVERMRERYMWPDTVNVGEVLFAGSRVGREPANIQKNFIHDTSDRDSLRKL